MDEEEKKIANQAKDEARKKKKMRKVIVTKMVAVLVPILIKLAILIIIITIASTLLGGFVKILRGDVFQWGATSTAKLEELNVINTEEGILNLSDDVVDELIKTMTDNGLNVARLKMLGEDNEEIENMTEDEITEGMRKYIRAYYAAELITQYPNMSDKPWEVEKKSLIDAVRKLLFPGTENETQGTQYQGCITLVKPDTDKNGNVIDGNVTLDENGKAKKEQYLTYLQEEQFQELCEHNKPEVLNHFTVTGNTIKVAGKTIITEVSDEGSSTEESYYTVALNYKAIASAYTMPMEFLLMMNLYSENPEFTYALARMVENSNIVLVVNYNYSREEQTVETDTERYIPPTQEPEYLRDSQGNIMRRKGTGEPIVARYVTIPGYWSGEIEHTTSTAIKETYTPVVQLTLADTWIVKKQVTVKKCEQTNNPEPEVENFENPEESRGTITTTNKYSSYTYQEDQTTEEEKTNLVLGLLKNPEGTYDKDNLLEFDPENRPKMKFVHYRIPRTIAERSPHSNLVSGAKMMLDDLEKNESTQTQAEIWKYLLYVYTGLDKYGGATEFGELSDLFATKTFLQNTGANSLAKAFIEAFEGTGPTEGDYYIVYSDSGGVLTVGHGVTIVNYGDKLKQAGATDLSEGAKIPKSIVDAVENDILSENMRQVEIETAGLNLTSYQKAALLSRYYNCGNINGFREAYLKYWKESDNRYNQDVTDSILYSHPLYTNYMKTPTKIRKNNTWVELPGLVERRRLEWLLFVTGKDKKNNIIWPENSNLVDMILQKAKEIHTYMEQNNYIYYTEGGSLPGSITGAWNNKNTCCATYVNWVLYEAGYTNLPSNIHSSPVLHEFLADKFETITSYDALQPGDIVFINSTGAPYSHVQIYAGNNLWYSAGSTDAIRRSNPYNQDNWARNHFTVGLRPVAP